MKKWLEVLTPESARWNEFAETLSQSVLAKPLVFQRSRKVL
jgi:hypothetical protein